MNRAKGFTLMEVMVAVSIFTIIVTVGIASLLIINNTHKKSQIDRQAVDSLSHVLESMSRSLRTAASWDSVAPTFIEFHDQDNKEVVYSYDGQALIQTDETGTHQITPEAVSITDFTITEFQGPTIQHYLQMDITGTITNGRQESSFHLRTGISKRILDL